VSTAQKSGGVHDVLTGLRVNWRRKSSDDCNCRKLGGNLLQHFARTRNEGRNLYQVARRIAAYDEFWKDNQISTARLGEPDVLTKLLRVAGEVPDSGVDLSECDLHRDSVKREGCKDKI